MRILSNNTSPYARIALSEKGSDPTATQFFNPWNDDPVLLAFNPAARVPTLETDVGLPITESLLILLWLEHKVPELSLLEGPVGLVIAQAGRAVGVIDAMANIVTGVMRMDPDWGETRVGLRRRRSVVNGLRDLKADPPAYRHGAPNVAVITAVVAIDYLRLRLGEASWVEPTPALDALRASIAQRPTFAATEPYL